MFVKVIKKNSSKVENNRVNTIHKEEKTSKNPEKKIERTILGWISELREKKVFEFNQPNFLTKAN